MCGLFGFIGTEPAAEIMRGAVKRARQRGPDGMAWWDGDRSRTDAVGGKLILGHCRLATSGAIGVLQPLVAGEFAITHNGNIRDHRSIAARLGIECETSVDSELILKLLARDGWPAVIRELPLSPGAVVAVEPAAIHLLSNKLPLYSLARPEGLYWCSTKGPEPGWEPVTYRTILR